MTHSFPTLRASDLIGGQPRLENIALAAEDFFLFAFGDDRADARARIEADDARAAGAQPLGERALRIEFELEKAGQILPLEFLIQIGKASCWERGCPYV